MLTSFSPSYYFALSTPAPPFFAAVLHARRSLISARNFQVRSESDPSHFVFTPESVLSLQSVSSQISESV